MEFDEKIHTHLMSVWRESKSFFGVGGKEGMLILTDNHFIFLKRTERMKKWWGAASKRQIVTLLQNKNTMTEKLDGYEEKDLDVDLEEVKKKYISKITFDNILEIGEEEKTWGSVLSIKAIEDGKEKKYAQVNVSKRAPLASASSGVIYVLEPSKIKLSPFDFSILTLPLLVNMVRFPAILSLPPNFTSRSNETALCSMNSFL